MRKSRASSVALSLAGAVVAPAAWAAGRVFGHPVLPHAIAAPRRVLAGASSGRISYYEDDGASGLPVVLLHGLGPLGSAYELRALFDALRADRPVVAPDLLGYGFSERRSEPYARDEYVRFVEELVADVSRRYGASVDVVAVGLTAEIAASVAARSSRYIRSLALISAAGLSPEPRVVALGRSLLAQPWLGAVAHRASSSRAALHALLARRSHLPVDDAFVRHASAAARQPRARGAIVSALSGALAAESSVYEDVRVPTCFVHGEADRVPRGAIDRLASASERIAKAEIRRARAMPHLERPVDTAEALRAFWRTLAIKPQLRLIRGEKTARSAGARWRGGARATSRRRTWT